LRILVVSNGFPPRGKWGTEFYTQELVRGLAARGHALAVLHPERGGARPRYTLEELDEGGLPLFLLHNPGGSRSAFQESYADAAVDERFAGVLERWRPDLVHFTYLLFGLSVRLPEVALARGVPSVLTLTDYGLACHRGQMFDQRLAPCGGPHPPAVCARCVRSASRYDGSRAEVLLRRAVAGLAARLGGLGVVVVTADLARREQHARAALGAVRRIIAPTPVVAERLRAFGAPPERIVELVYAFDERPWQAARPEPRGPEHVFAFLGQFAPQKGLTVLLDAVERMQARLPESVEPWHLRLYGAPAGSRHRRYGPAALARASVREGLRVRLEGAFEPACAPAVFSELSTIVVPSLWDENAPLTLLQARAAGVPVVASDVRGIACVLGPEHGRLVPPGDPQALADGMRAELLARRRRTRAPGLPLSLAEHLDRIEEIHGAARAGS
jgi:glycosyltransferase involved in cell wall biosynthesis